jgi:hypothetical protein
MSEIEHAPATQPDPIATINRDDLVRSRLTVFFRILLAIPHLLWFGIWTTGMLLLSPVLWIATLINGKPPDGLRDLYAMWIRYAVHVYAYTGLVANPFPGFLGKPGTYPVEVELPQQPERQNRWSVFFRFFLALPPMLLAGTLSGGGLGNSSGLTISFGVLSTVAFLGWFAAMARAQMPPGLQSAGVYTLEYTAQTYAYLFLLTDRYPDSHPGLAAQRDLPEHPVTLGLDDDPRRSRLTVFFRILLAIPHIVWLMLWGLVVYLAGIVNWFYTLFAGRPWTPLYRFTARFVRYTTHVNAFIYLVGGPFPGFAGVPGSYPVDVDFPAEPPRQNRWKTGFRGLLAFPALFISGAINGALFVGAIGAWWYAIVTGRMPIGVRALGAWNLRYAAQTYAYLFLITDVYPYSAPGPCGREPAREELPPAPAVTPEPAPVAPPPEAV